MEWDWLPDKEAGKESGVLTFYFINGACNVNLPTFKVAYTLMEAVDLEIRNVRIDEVKSAYRRITEVLVPNAEFSERRSRPLEC